MIAQPPPLVRQLLLPAMLAACLTACSGAPPEARDSRGQAVASAAASGSATDAGSRAANVALQQVGTPYRYGGNSPGGFDCSGLVHYSYGVAGKAVPRTTAAQYSSLDPVARDAMRAGDVLFFRIDGKMSHVGLYLGNGRFVHAPKSGRKVSVENLRSEFYSAAFIRAGRPN